MISNNKESKNLSQNLKTLCSYYKSISDVCRKTNLNRQQFNRYLNGSTFPSYSNLKTICDFFGVDQDEIIKDPVDFKKIISETTEDNKTNDIPEAISSYLDILKNSSKYGLDRYCGYYYRYILSGGFPGNILKSLIRIYKKDDFFYYWHVDSLTSQSPAIKKTARFRYDGIVFMISERIYITELESKLKSTISETILMPRPSYQHGNRNLSGITCYSTSDISHQPVSSRVFHEYLGEKINIRQKINECDLFPTDSNSISEDIKEAIFSPPLLPTDLLSTN